MAETLTTVRNPLELREACDSVRKSGQIGFVPTMGALHEGHLSLVRGARARADFVVASIFVNPTQFGPNEDFERYPRDEGGDMKKLASAGASLLFAPDTNAMYAAGEETRVRVGALAEHLCGPFRPGHFEGVATIVAKLFGLVGESVAVFGRKDYQQLRILQRIATDLFFPVEVVGMPIVREADGVAMSSRNAYLSPADRERARGLSAGLSHAWREFEKGERDAETLRNAALTEVMQVADRIDYVSVVDADSLQPIAEKIGARALVAIACHIGKTRLIDNVVLGEDPDPRASVDAHGGEG
ncbi:MAG: pantoate--beta-alanine ligase [Polyangiaceae bacterium]